MNIRIPHIVTCNGIMRFTNPLDTSFLFALSNTIPNDDLETISPILVGSPPSSMASWNTLVDLFINSEPLSPMKLDQHILGSIPLINLLYNLFTLFSNDPTDFLSRWLSAKVSVVPVVPAIEPRLFKNGEMYPSAFSILFSSIIAITPIGANEAEIIRNIIHGSAPVINKIKEAIPTAGKINMHSLFAISCSLDFIFSE